MGPFAAVVRKQLVESRWLLGITAAALLLLSFFFTFAASRIEATMRRASDPLMQMRGRMQMRAFAGPAGDDSSTTLVLSFWIHPVIVMILAVWPITRAAGGFAGEIERGTLDLVLSRPVSRAEYLASHVVVAVLGLVALAASLILGNLFGSLFFAVKAPPGVLALLAPATMVVSLGLAAYGYTLPFSAIDIVRWRPGLIASALTLGGLIAMTVAPQFEDYEWLLEKLSIFRAYAPVTVAMRGEPLLYNTTVLVGVFAAGLTLAFLAFASRDLPANS